MVPDLQNVVREGLKAKQVSTEAANSYLKDLKSLPRYNKAFKLFLGILHSEKCFSHQRNIDRSGQIIVAI